MTEELREVHDLERAPGDDEIGTEATQYGKGASEFADEGAGPDTGEQAGQDAEDEHQRGEN